MKWLLVLFLGAFGDPNPDSGRVATFATNEECQLAGINLVALVANHTDDKVAYVCAETGKP